MPIHATITFVKPYADLSYRKLEATNIRFIDFIELVKTDTVLLSDVIGFITAKNIEDTLTITEAQFFDTTKALSDTLGFSDSLSKTIIYNRTASDLFTLAEALVQTLNKELVDGINLPDVLTLLNNKEFADSISFTDTQGFTHSKSLTDSFALDDAALVNKNYTGNKGNVFSVSDQISISRTHGKALGNMTLNSLTLN